MQWHWWYLAIPPAFYAAGIFTGLLRLRREGRLGKFTWH
jgi:hypothetical protein